MDKLSLELTVDATGEPVIKVVHYDKSDELQQLLFRMFIERAKAGLHLRMLSSCSHPSITVYHIESESCVDYAKKLNTLLEKNKHMQKDLDQVGSIVGKWCNAH